MAVNKWKDFLLKSGLPLEYEIKRYLESKGCISSFEFSYLRPDENHVINEFSFDIDSAYLKGEHFFQFLIECKYRDPSTNWLFLPGEFGGSTELGKTSCLHPGDHFTKSAKFPFKHPELPEFAKACQKGIEITSEGPNPKTITQATMQISYAMAELIVDHMLTQIEEALATSEVIFYNIPIIVTTANIYRLKESATIKDIKDAADLLELATKEDCVVLETKVGRDLQKHNERIFQQFIDKHGKEFLESKLKSFNTDINFLCKVIAGRYCPQSILVIQHTDDNNAFEKLFALLQNVVSPSKEIKDHIRNENERFSNMMKGIKQKIEDKQADNK